MYIGKRRRRRVRDLRGLSASRGWRAVDEDGEPGLKVRRSGGCGQVPQPGQDLVHRTPDIGIKIMQGWA